MFFCVKFYQKVNFYADIPLQTEGLYQMLLVTFTLGTAVILIAIQPIVRKFEKIYSNLISFFSPQSEIKSEVIGSKIDFYDWFATLY